MSEGIVNTRGSGNWDLQTMHQFGPVHRQPPLQSITHLPSKKESSRKTIMDEHKQLVIGVKDWAGNSLPPSLSSRADYNWRDVKYSCLLDLVALYFGFGADLIWAVRTDTRVWLQ